MAPCTECASRPVRVDTVHVVRVDTVRSVHADTVRLPLPPTTDQVVLRVQFRTDRADLLPVSRPVLNTVAAAIKATPNSRWQVEGHSDSVGSDAANKALSQARAQAVVDYLVLQGVDRSTMTAVGFGPDRPVFSNSTAEGRAQNRRVQLRRVPPPPVERVP
jgi:outer membrane protein OmpA-like peptidoglycan-associated protein